MTFPSTVVIAPDSFKGSASARAVAESLKLGWLSVRPADNAVLLPLADGGEGTMDAVSDAVAGAVARPVLVDGPDSRPLVARWLELPPDAALIELAPASGLTQMKILDPFHAHTKGFGQAIRAALDAGARRVTLAIGGSASIDGGAGALMALGAHLLDRRGRPIPLGNEGLAELHSVDLDEAWARFPESATVLSDVTAPLLGGGGAVAVFGPQKGATLEQLPRLEANLSRFAAIVGGPVDEIGAGAAGGVGFGIRAWGANAVGGASAVADVVGLAGHLRKAAAVITGEGAFDSQTSLGKVVSEVVRCADEAKVPVYLVAGRIDADPSSFADWQSLTSISGSSERALADPHRFLIEAGVRLARSYSRAQGE